LFSVIPVVSDAFSVLLRQPAWGREGRWDFAVYQIGGEKGKIFFEISFA
jgi:hypothetical protein